MKHLFIVNPKAGKGKGLSLIPQIEDFFNYDKNKYVVEITAHPGHATEIARKYASEGDYRIYSVGGDGTLNEVLNGMIGSSCSLGIIPTGSGNDFMRYFIGETFSKDMLYDIINAPTKKIDIGKVNDRYFINISSVGFDAEVAYNADKFKRIPFVPSKASYLMAIFKTLLSNKSHSLKMKIDDNKLDIDCLALIAANGKYYGGGMMPTPNADVSDEFFDICSIEKKNVFEILRFFPKMINGTHGDIKGVTFYKAKNVRIKSKSNIALNFDGDVLKGTHFNFKIIPKAIDMIVPEMSEQGMQRMV